MRNYQNEVKPQCGRTLFECKDVDCGGSQKLSWGGGNPVEQTALLLKNQPVLKLMVVGHMDNVGGFSGRAKNRRVELVPAS